MKSVKNQKPQKLVLRRETLVVLTSRKLVLVHGGEPTSSEIIAAYQGGEHPQNPGLCG